MQLTLLAIAAYTEHDPDRIEAQTPYDDAIALRLLPGDCTLSLVAEFSCEPAELQGAGAVTFDDLGPRDSAMNIDWRVSTGKAWMRRTSWLLRPVFVLGHHLVMHQGEKHLNAWLRKN